MAAALVPAGLAFGLLLSLEAPRPRSSLGWPAPPALQRRSLSLQAQPEPLEQPRHHAPRTGCPLGAPRAGSRSDGVTHPALDGM